MVWRGGNTAKRAVFQQVVKHNYTKWRVRRLEAAGGGWSLQGGDSVCFLYLSHWKPAESLSAFPAASLGLFFFFPCWNHPECGKINEETCLSPPPPFIYTEVESNTKVFTLGASRDRTFRLLSHFNHRTEWCNYFWPPLGASASENIVSA